jgi:four helix bundle protein
MKESPIFTRTFDLLAWLLPMTEKFPRSQRFVLAKRVQDAALDFYAAITAAAIATADRAHHLEQADIELQRLRLYLRLSHQLRFMSMGQYEHVSRMVLEVGKLLGGWQKKVVGKKAA